MNTFRDYLNKSRQINESFYIDKIDSELYYYVKKIEGYKEGKDSVYVDGYTTEIELINKYKVRIEVLSSRGSIATGQQTSLVLEMKLKDGKFRADMRMQKMKDGKPGKMLSKDSRVPLATVENRKKFVKLVEKRVGDYVKTASDEALEDIGYNFKDTLDIMTGKKEAYAAYTPIRTKYKNAPQDAFPNTGAYFHNI